MEKLRSLFSISQTAAGPALPITQRSLTRSSSSSVFQEQDLGKVLLNLAFSATIALVVLFLKEGSLMGQVEPQPPISLRLLAMAILMAFSASFLAISLVRILPKVARALEHIGIVSTVVAFSLLMGFLLPSFFKWVALVACVVSLLAYLGAHFASDGVVEEVGSHSASDGVVEEVGAHSASDGVVEVGALCGSDGAVEEGYINGDSVS